MEIDYSSIGMRIRRLRKAKGFTQETLAELSGIEPSNISHIERGATKLSLPTLVSIANALGVTADDILCDSIDKADTPYLKEMGRIISDCNHIELKILTEMLVSMKRILREVG